MSLYAISDLHLAIFNKEKSMEVFQGWEDYTKRLEKNWKALINDNDDIVVIGDISWALKLEQARDDLAFLDSLPGRKFLIKGNHDLWWSSRKKIETFFEKNNFNTLNIIYNNAYVSNNVAICGSRGWLYDSKSQADKKILLREAGRLETSIKEAKACSDDIIVFIHYPPIFSDFKSSEILNVLFKYNIKKCYFGHIHGSIASKIASIDSYNGIKFNLVSADYQRFTPLLVKK